MEVKRQDMNKKYNMIVPTIPKDYIRNKNNYKYFFRFLPIKELVFIGPSELEKEILTDYPDNIFNEVPIRFINENDIISFNLVMEAMKSRLIDLGFSMANNSNPGWYYQQFLKLSYSQLCADEYYFTWDGDTIPVKEISFFADNAMPYFDIKPEYNPGYFNTISRLLPGLSKTIDQSFISEHMIFNVEYVKELLSEIMASTIPGDSYFTKILNSISAQDMALGFSEFETYGTYMYVNHPEKYILRDWSSMRYAGYLFEPSKLDESDIEWLAKDYDAITFEGYNNFVPELSALFHDPNYRKLLSPKQIYDEFVNSGLLGTSDKLILPK